MTRLLDSWRWALLALPLAAVVLFGACGGGDDSSSDSSSKDTGSGKSSSIGATGSDAKFVADICKGIATFEAAMTKITSNQSKVTNPEDAVKAFAKPFDQLAKDFSDAKPPKDLQKWHKDASDALNKAAAALKKGDITALSSFGEELANPPKGADARLTKIAEGNKDCKEANVDFSGN